MKYLRTALAALCATALVSVLAATSAGASSVPRTTPVLAEASIIQGLPKTSVDVYLNGTEIVQDFRFKGVVGPLPLVPGKYHVAIRLHGAKAGSTPLLSATRWLVAGENISFVADLTPAGAPALTTYWNPDPTIARGRAELAVRNVAEDPGVNVYASGLRIFRNLQNPSGANVRLPSEWVKLRMTLFGSPTTIIGPVSVHLRSQTVTIVYAVGSAATDTLGTVEQSYSVG